MTTVRQATNDFNNEVSEIIQQRTNGLITDLECYSAILRLTDRSTQLEKPEPVALTPSKSKTVKR